jgi:aminoglycoside 6'-N-acetyltransferase
VEPWEFAEPIRTERLVLRVLEPSDAPAVHAWMGDPEVARYQLYEPRSLDVVEEKVAEYAQARRLAEKGDYIQPAIVVDDEVVGAMYLTIASLDDATAEIGWALRADRQGRGYATEAATALLDLAFGPLGMHRVVAELDPRNLASVALCERLGMRHEAHFVENLWFKGEWADTGIYAILDREWTAPPP